MLTYSIHHTFTGRIHTTRRRWRWGAGRSGGVLNPARCPSAPLTSPNLLSDLWTPRWCFHFYFNPNIPRRWQPGAYCAKGLERQATCSNMHFETYCDTAVGSKAYQCTAQQYFPLREMRLIHSFLNFTSKTLFYEERGLRKQSIFTWTHI